MSKLINYNSIEGKALKELFQNNMIDSYIALIVESYIYKEVIEYYKDTGAPHPATKQTKEKYTMKYGKKEGICYMFNKYGELEKECNYKNGKKEGLEISYKFNKIHKKTNYKEDKKDGLKEEWYKNGQKYYQHTYKEDKYNGLYQEWFKNGQKKIECTYNGVYELWYETGMEGLYEEWYENGQKKIECSHKKGQYDGLFEEWYENGQKKQESFYNKEGNKEGLENKWHENGQKSCEIIHIEGKQYHQSWFDNGQKEQEAAFITDGCYEWDIDGEFKMWNKQGNLRIYEIHKEGKLIKKIK